MKLRFLCVGGFTCSVQSTLRNAKHEHSRGSGRMPPRKMHALRLNLAHSEAKNCYSKDRLWKSAVREISLSERHQHSESAASTSLLTLKNMYTILLISKLSHT